MSALALTLALAHVMLTGGSEGPPLPPPPDVAPGLSAEERSPIIASPGVGGGSADTRTPPSLKGQSTWYAYHEGQAAAGPRLRSFLGSHWRGRSVDVCVGRSCVTVRLTDWCACNPSTRLVDLNSIDFAKLAPLSRGVIRVTVRPSE